MGKEKEIKVLDAAASVFLRYGYRRTTMGDIASAAGMSRPALYLLFCDKQRIFEATLRRFGGQQLEAIRLATEGMPSPLDKLKMAMEIWTVQPFELMARSPDARDLVQCGFEFAGEALDQNDSAFEALLVSILETFPGSRRPELEPIAHLLAVSTRGFKEAARTTGELRALIDALLSLTAKSLQQIP